MAKFLVKNWSLLHKPINEFLTYASSLFRNWQFNQVNSNDFALSHPQQRLTCPPPALDIFRTNSLTNSDLLRNLYFYTVHSGPSPRRHVSSSSCLFNQAQQESGKKPDTKKNSKIVYSVVPKEKSYLASDFLIKYYHKYEPITAALQMPKDEVDGWFHRYLRMSMFSSVCDVTVQAIDESKAKRVGILSSIIIDPNRSRPVLDDFVDPVKHPVNVTMNEFYEKLEKGLDPVAAVGMKDAKYPPKVLEHLFISVHPKYSGQGIANHMLKLCESLASNVLNCRVGYMITTSAYSFTLFEKHSYKIVKEIKYSEYTNSKGEKIFAGKEEIMKPHLSCKAMVKEFPCLYGFS